MKTLREYIEIVNELSGEPPLYPNYQQLPGPQSTAVARPNTTGVATVNPPNVEKVAGSGSSSDLRSKLPGSTTSASKQPATSKLGVASAGAGGALGGAQDPGTISGSPVTAAIQGGLQGGVPGAAAGLAGWGAARAATKGTDPRIGGWGDTAAQTAQKQTMQQQKPSGLPPAQTAPAKTNPADFDKWREQPSASQLTQPPQNPIAGALPATTPQPQAQPQGASATPAVKWPTSKQEIIAFQKANGLKPDGLIGWRTEQALAQKGITPPKGFQVVNDRTPKKAAPQGGQPAQAAPQGEPPLGQTAAYPPVASTAPVQPKTTDPNSPFYIPANPAVEKYKAQQAAKGQQSPANQSLHQQMANLGTVRESSELYRILTLADLNKN